MITERIGKSDSIPSIVATIEKHPKDELILLSKIDSSVQESDSEILKKYDQSNADVILPSSANFPFKAQGLNLYYWKYYPRERGTYHFVYPKMWLGKGLSLVQYFTELQERYGEKLLQESFAESTSQIDVFHRYYLDSAFGLEKEGVRQHLDQDQHFFGISDGRRSIAKWPLFSLRHGLIFYKYHQTKLGLKDQKGSAWDFREKNGKTYNERLKTLPSIVEKVPSDKVTFGQRISAFTAYLHSVLSILKIRFYNGGKRKDHEIFRFRHNQNVALKRSIDKMIQHLDTGQPFSFTHFNDGEMTFIKKYKEQDHKEVWFGSYFGRIQEKYNLQLGELLTAAFLKRQDYYYIGIPCEISHPKLSEYAKELRPVDDFTIPAMTFHHNLSKYPRIMGAIRKRKVYFVVNVNQDLSFFKKQGFHFEDEQIIRVPFRNAHEQYENLKNLKFEKGAVVLLMSGMLAKILCAIWFQNNSSTTFIAFGSSFDDYIQSNINFSLYPKDFPFSKTLIGSRSYLFGHKGSCKGCYDMSKPNRGTDAV